MRVASAERGASKDGKPKKRAARLGPELRRPLILDAAYDVFLERGFDGASMAAIAEQAGVTKPVIYDSFANKDELFDALRARERDQIMAEVIAALPEDPGVDLEATVIAGLASFLRYVQERPEPFRLIMLGEGASGEAAERIQQRRAGYIEMVATMIDDWGRTSGGPSPGIDLIANSLVGAIEGVARAIMNQPDRFDPDAAARLVGRVLARGAAAL